MLPISLWVHCLWLISASFFALTSSPWNYLWILKAHKQQHSCSQYFPVPFPLEAVFDTSWVSVDVRPLFSSGLLCFIFLSRKTFLLTHPTQCDPWPWVTVVTLARKAASGPLCLTPVLPQRRASPCQVPGDKAVKLHKDLPPGHNESEGVDA